MQVQAIVLQELEINDFWWMISADEVRQTSQIMLVVAQRALRAVFPDFEKNQECIDAVRK